jgi:hypothetical protein
MKSAIRMPKSERNPKPEARMGLRRSDVIALLRISDFGLPSDFGFRISDFERQDT